MRRDKALDILRAEKVRLEQRYGLTALGIFGSTARDEADVHSDVDVIVRVQKPDIYQLVELREDLCIAFGSNVDLVHEHRFIPARFRRRLEAEAIYV